jgi:hypothetical protein
VALGRLESFVEVVKRIEKGSLVRRLRPQKKFVNWTQEEAMKTESVEGFEEGRESWPL